MVASHATIKDRSLPQQSLERLQLQLPIEPGSSLGNRWRCSGPSWLPVPYSDSEVLVKRPFEVELLLPCLHPAFEGAAHAISDVARSGMDEVERSLFLFKPRFKVDRERGVNGALGRPYLSWRQLGQAARKGIHELVQFFVGKGPVDPAVHLGGLGIE